MCKSVKYGFTIIELLIVLVIVAIILTISIPAIANLTSPKYLLKKEARRITAFMWQARTKAMNQKIPIELWFDPAQNTLYAQKEAFSKSVQTMENEESLEQENRQVVQTLRLDEKLVIQPLSAEDVVALSSKQTLFETLDESVENDPLADSASSEKIHLLTFTHYGGSDGGGISIAYKKDRLNIVADILCGSPKIMRRKNNE